MSLSQSSLGTPGVLPFVKHIADSLTPDECDYPRYECDYECYVLDSNNCEIRKVLKRFPDAATGFSSFVVLGSCIYVLGGTNHNSEDSAEFSFLKDVFCFEDSDNNLEKSWENVSYMLSTRSCPRSAVLDGKIYVFGHSIEGGFAEVYDTSNRRWASLDDKKPSEIFGGTGSFFISFPVLADSSHGRILVHNHFTGSLYAYYIDDRNWECVDEKYGKWTAAVVGCGGVIYSLSEYKNDTYCFKSTYCSLGVYDLGEKKHLSTKWSSDSVPKLRVVCHAAGLFHLGNDEFCLVWQDFDVIKYMKFNVRKNKDSGEILVIPKPICVAGHGVEGLADFSVIR